MYSVEKLLRRFCQAEKTAKKNIDSEIVIGVVIFARIIVT
jgi:hypothetical protein